MRRVPATTWAIVCLLGGVWFAAGLQIAPVAKRHDFLNLYTGATLAREGKLARLHVVEDQLAVERRVDPNTSVLVPFVRPPFYAALLSPLSAWPLETAYRIWVGTQIVFLAFVCWWGVRRFGPDALALAAMYVPTALGIAHGQDCTWMLLIVLGAYWAAERGKLSLAGAIFGLTLVKFHLLLLVPITAAIRREWKFLAGYVAAGATLLATCLMLSGVDGLIQYARLLTNKDLERLSPSEDLMINVKAFVLNLGIDSNLLPIVLAVGIVAVVVVSLRRAPLWRWLAGSIAGSLLIAPHVYGYDAALLLVPLWCTVFISTSRMSRILATTLCTPIPFLLAMAGRPWAIAGSAALLAYLVAVVLENWKENAIVCTDLHLSLQSANGRPHARANRGVATEGGCAPESA